MNWIEHHCQIKTERKQFRLCLSLGTGLAEVDTQLSYSCLVPKEGHGQLTAIGFNGAFSNILPWNLREKTIWKWSYGFYHTVLFTTVLCWLRVVTVCANCGRGARALHGPNFFSFPILSTFCALSHTLFLNCFPLFFHVFSTTFRSEGHW